MSQRRIDEIARLVATPGSRRRVVSLLAAAAWGTAGLYRQVRPALAGRESGCRAGGVPCRSNGQCCSGRCRLRRGGKRGRKRGRCESLGPFAADCPKVTTCSDGSEAVHCRVGGIDGLCTVSASGAPFCEGSKACIAGSNPICASDEDCAVVMSNPAAKCLPCPGSSCGGEVMCAVYLGDI